MNRDTRSYNLRQQRDRFLFLSMAQKGQKSYHFVVCNIKEFYRAVNVISSTDGCLLVRNSKMWLWGGGGRGKNVQIVTSVTK